MVRGFYGGGEADYVLVMVDGRVMNLAHNGTIAWETLPAITDIESIEIVRGSASALHGDAAVAGVINIVTRRRVSVAGDLALGARVLTRASRRRRRSPIQPSTTTVQRVGRRSSAPTDSGTMRRERRRRHDGSMRLLAAGAVRRRAVRGATSTSPGRCWKASSATASESDPRFALRRRPRQRTRGRANFDSLAWRRWDGAHDAARRWTRRATLRAHASALA